MTEHTTAPDALAPPPEFPSASILDSRRLLGPNLHSTRTGAVLEVHYAEVRAKSLIDTWSVQVGHVVHALQWPDAELHVRRGSGGAALFLSAPVDVLMTATVLNEQAWVAAESPLPRRPDEDLVGWLRAAADRERQTRPNLSDVYGEAVRLGFNVTFDDEMLSVGSGSGALSWALDRIPALYDIPWADVYDVPIALVTGSNGKTTTVRLVGAMWSAAGKSPGWSCSDGVWVNNEPIALGDYAGPAGARVVLRNADVEAAVLETARGGILRRGLAVTRADAAIITNISADHFGEYGVDTLRHLTEAKGAVARVVMAHGQLVLNADDAQLGDLALEVKVPCSWFSIAPVHPELDAHVSMGGDAAIVNDGSVMLRHHQAWYDLGAVNDMPITLYGAAPHNIANILGASLVAAAMGVPIDAIRDTLRTFGASPMDNPGRLQVYRFGELTLLVDYAHNPDGLAALCETASSFLAKRQLLLLGQAGNRDDEQLRELARAAWNVMHFDRVIIKEMPSMLRGRSAGEVSRVLMDELLELGAPRERMDVIEGELTAIRRAFAWARDGDLLVCPVHVEKEAVLAWLGRLSEAKWRPGALLPV